MQSLQHYAEVIRTVFHDACTLSNARFKAVYFTRKKKMPFKSLLHFMLSGRKAATQAALDEYFQKEGNIHMSQQAFSKARNHFDHSPFEKAFYATRDSDYNLNSDASLKRFHGYKIFAIDGTTIALPNIPELKKEFGTVGAGNSSPSARGSICYDVMNDRIVDAAITPLSTDERSLAECHLANLNGAILMEDSLFIFDRGYASKKLMDYILLSHGHFLMRVRRKFSLAVDHAPLGDSLVMVGDAHVRVVKFELPSGEIETLITDVVDLPEALFPTLYFLRWPVEIKYDMLKNKLELPNFTGWSSNVIRQDFWISMLLANVAAAAKTEADVKVKQAREGKDNKYEYQTNVNTIVASVRNRFADAVFDRMPLRREYKINAIIKEVAQSVVPIRPDRCVPRKSNNRTVKYHHNKKSNV